MDKECYICQYRGKGNVGDRAVMHFAFDNPHLRLVQKPTNKIEPKFKVGDWIINNDKRLAVPMQILTIEEYGYATSMGYTSFDKVKTDYHLWTIQDAKDGDVITNGETVVIFKCFEELYNQYLVAYIGLDTGGTIQITNERWSLGIDKAKPATKEQRDFLFQKIKEAGYEWDAEKKELKIVDWSKHIKYEPNGPSTLEKFKMSEENEDALDIAIRIIQNGGDNCAGILDSNKALNWLKSLKDRV